MKVAGGLKLLSLLYRPLTLQKRVWSNHMDFIIRAAGVVDSLNILCTTSKMVHRAHVAVHYKTFHMMHLTTNFFWVLN